MKFLALDEETWLTGEVWSPGPEAHSVWVLSSDGKPRAVKLPTKARPEPREIDWSPTRGSAVLSGPQYVRLAMKFAPALPAKDWQAALRDT